MMGNERSTLRSIAQAGLLLVAVAFAAHLVWSLLAPILPALLAIFLTAMLAYLFMGRRS